MLVRPSFGFLVLLLFRSALPVSTYSHTVAILTYPLTSRDQILNESIVQQAVEKTSEKLRVVIRIRDQLAHRTPVQDLRRYVGEVYSLAWDCHLNSIRSSSSSMSSSSNSNNNGNSSKNKETNMNEKQLLDVIVYPQSLPNAAPEQWLYHRPSLECICSADEMLGWYSKTPSTMTSSSSSTETNLNDNRNPYENVDGQGFGGLKAHCDAVNDDRKSRGLNPVEMLRVKLPRGLSMDDMMELQGEVQFLEDIPLATQLALAEAEKNDLSSMGILGGSRLDDNLYDSVAVGGTFDGLHYGHRKLLTLAVSSVYNNAITQNVNEGRLLIGVTSDEMLKGKKFAQYIAPVEERIKLVKDFIADLAPGIKNKVRVEVIHDAFGPTATEEHFSALVLSHETLENGLLLNDVRRKNGFKPLTLLCTRRTEANSMSSTTLRQIKRAAD